MTTGPANPPLRLLAIDPGLAHAGVAVVDVAQVGQVTIRYTATIRTRAKAPLPERLGQVVGGVLDLPAGSLPVEASVVIEDPTETVQSDRQGQRKDPRNLYKLMAAFGAIVEGVRCALPDPGRLHLVPVGQWFPRADHRGHLKQEHVLAYIRARYPQVVGKSEHVAMAVGLADWWSRNVAPRVWFDGLGQLVSGRGR